MAPPKLRASPANSTLTEDAGRLQKFVAELVEKYGIVEVEIEVMNARKRLQSLFGQQIETVDERAEHLTETKYKDSQRKNGPKEKKITANHPILKQLRSQLSELNDEWTSLKNKKEQNLNNSDLKEVQKKMNKVRQQRKQVKVKLQELLGLPFPVSSLVVDGNYLKAMYFDPIVGHSRNKSLGNINK